VAPFFRMDAEACPKRPASVRWSVELVVFQAILMVYESGATLSDRFPAARACVIEMFPSRRWLGQTYQGFIKAQKKFSPAMVEHMQDHLRGQHQRVAGDSWKRFGWIPFACDGSRVEVPRTKANAVLGCAGRKKTGPQLFVTTLYHMGTGLPWNWHIGAGTESERDHLRAMLTLAIKDSYRRHGSKRARDWPHKKKESPPGAPEIRLPTRTEIKQAQKVRNAA